MSATSIFFNGRVISIPGSYSQVDDSGLESVGLGANGILAIIGTAEGGKPVFSIDEPKDLLRFSNPDRAQAAFRDGELREAMPMAFGPSKDDAIQAGAQQVVALKVNRALPSTVDLANGITPSVRLTSKDYGAFTQALNVEVLPPTDTTSLAGGGKKVLIRFEEKLETLDNLGGFPLFQLKYTPGTFGYTAVTASLSNVLATLGQLTINGVHSAIPGLQADINGTQLAAPDTIQVVAAAGDVGQVVTVYGRNGAIPVRETFTLNAAVVQPGLVTFTEVYGAEVDRAHATTITIQRTTGAVMIMTMLTTILYKGLVHCIAHFAQGTVTVTPVGTAPTGARVILVGRSTFGAIQMEIMTMGATTVPVVSAATNWARIDAIVTGNVSAAQFSGGTTLTATLLQSDVGVHKNLQKLKDFVSPKKQTLQLDDAGVALLTPVTFGMAFTMATGKTLYPVSKLDPVPGAQDIRTPAAPGYAFYANFWSIVDGITGGSGLVVATQIDALTPIMLPPSNTPAPLFFTGGDEGSASMGDWDKAFRLCKKARINSICVLTANPAIHAALDTHLALMSGVGRNEGDGSVGLQHLLSGSPDGTVATKDEIKSQIVNLNSRHIQAFAQTVDRFNIAGDLTTFPSYFQGVLAKGMQAGAQPGTPLTFKFVNVNGFSQHSSWNPVEDAEEMIQGGLTFLENVEGIGRRWLRSITTRLASNKINQTEASVNNAVNYSTYNFRTAMELSVGAKGFAGSIAAAKGRATSILTKLLGPDVQAIVDYRSLDIQLVLDVLEVSVEMAPVIGINFVKNVIHLVTIRQAA